MLRVCDVAAIIPRNGIIMNDVGGKDKELLSFISKKDGMRVAT